MKGGTLGSECAQGCRSPAGRGAECLGQVSWPGLPQPLPKKPPCPLDKVNQSAFTSQEFEPRDTDSVRPMPLCHSGRGTVSQPAGGRGKEEELRALGVPPLLQTSRPALRESFGSWQPPLAPWRTLWQPNLPDFLHLSTKSASKNT